jgi:bifunctional DNA-binding transcriptional regulator/antitoxin component of YhaV-PrlF toxin-antitoxin module
MPRISGKHQVTLPVESLERAGLKPGDEVRIEAEGLARPSASRRARVSNCVLDTDAVIAVLDDEDAHHRAARRAVVVAAHGSENGWIGMPWSCSRIPSS